MARLDVRAQAQQAAIQSLPGAFGAAGAESHDRLGDTLSQMERLRRQLGARFEDAAEDLPVEALTQLFASDAPVSTSQRRAI